MCILASHRCFACWYSSLICIMMLPAQCHACGRRIHAFASISGGFAQLATCTLERPRIYNRFHHVTLCAAHDAVREAVPGLSQVLSQRPLPSMRPPHTQCECTPCASHMMICVRTRCILPAIPNGFLQALSALVAEGYAGDSGVCLHR